VPRCRLGLGRIDHAEDAVEGAGHLDGDLAAHHGSVGGDAVDGRVERVVKARVPVRQVRLAEAHGEVKGRAAGGARGRKRREQRERLLRNHGVLEGARRVGERREHRGRGLQRVVRGVRAVMDPQRAARGVVVARDERKRALQEELVGKARAIERRGGRAV
jgi:orotidine-5'-phosphate decarboxylase